MVDDEGATVILLRDMLRHAGFQVSVARDGQEALARAHESIPDVVFMDVMMPGIDGREVARRFRADPRLRYVPIVLHSSADEMDVDWRAAGAVAFVQKPFAFHDLPDFLRQYTR